MKMLRALVVLCAVWQSQAADAYYDIKYNASSWAGGELMLSASAEFGVDFGEHCFESTASQLGLGRRLVEETELGLETELGAETGAGRSLIGVSIPSAPGGGGWENYVNNVNLGVSAVAGGKFCLDLGKVYVSGAISVGCGSAKLEVKAAYDSEYINLTYPGISVSSTSGSKAFVKATKILGTEAKMGPTINLELAGGYLEIKLGVEAKIKPAGQGWKDLLPISIEVPVYKFKICNGNTLAEDQLANSHDVTSGANALFNGLTKSQYCGGRRRMSEVPATLSPSRRRMLGGWNSPQLLCYSICQNSPWQADSAGCTQCATPPQTKNAICSGPYGAEEAEEDEYDFDASEETEEELLDVVSAACEDVITDLQLQVEESESKLAEFSDTMLEYVLAVEEQKDLKLNPVCDCSYIGVSTEVDVNVLCQTGDVCYNLYQDWCAEDEYVCVIQSQTDY